MRIKIITAIMFCSASISYGQQIGNGYADLLQDFTTPLLSGLYGGPHAVGKAPDNSHDWQHLFVIRHPNPDNNYQLQLSSTYSENDKLFFRKIDNTTNSVWYELATRGTNSFIGNQHINGNLAVGNSSTSNSKLEITGGDITTSLTNINNTLTQRINTANPSISIGLGYLNTDMPFIQSFNNITLSSNSLNLNPFGGNVGIGTVNPTSKLESVSTSAGLTPFKTIGTNGYLIVDNVGSGENYFSANKFHEFQINGSSKVRIDLNGNVGIGINNPQNKLDVNGTIHSKEVKVDMSGWSDFVFKKEYKLPTLEEVEKHIAEKGHLENIPSEEEVLKNGINLGEMNSKLLQKIEELTLYSIQQNKKIEEQSKEIESLKSLILRVAKIENELGKK